jgi:transposase
VERVKEEQRDRDRETAYQYWVDGASVNQISKTMHMRRSTVARYIAAEADRRADERASQRTRDLEKSISRRDDIVLRCRTRMNGYTRKLNTTGENAPGWQERATLMEAIAKCERQIGMTQTQLDAVTAVKTKPTEEPPKPPSTVTSNILVMLDAMPPEEARALVNDARAQRRLVEAARAKTNEQQAPDDQ